MSDWVVVFFAFGLFVAVVYALEGASKIWIKLTDRSFDMDVSDSDWDVDGPYYLSTLGSGAVYVPLIPDPPVAEFTPASRVECEYCGVWQDPAGVCERCGAPLPGIKQ